MYFLYFKFSHILNLFHILFQIHGGSKNICSWIWSLWFDTWTFWLYSKHSGMIKLKILKMKFISLCFIKRLSSLCISYYLILLNFFKDNSHRNRETSWIKWYQFQLWWFGFYIPCYVQNSCRNYSQQQLHCLCYFEGKALLI